MTRTPLTREQAERICKDHQYLAGREFKNEHSVAATIEAVTVAPYDDINKYIFLLAYCESNDLKAALDSYVGHVFDVLIVGKCSSETAELVHKELIPYLAENNIPFDLAKYVSAGGASSNRQLSYAS
ncbi:MAG: hypothetical protein JSS82_03705 [Bacteroidetes bacterium]|nr:hypothetical protein [Bacteroidota bacterium]